MGDKFELDSDSLKIGDCVVLRDVLKGCNLCVEGILQEDLCGVDDSENLLDSVFCIHLQRQYSASRDLDAFLKHYDMDVRNIVDDGAKRYLKALQRGLENEKKLNDNYMKKKLGQLVLFGDIIQLFHVKSRKYLQAKPDELAKDERDNIRVKLDASGSSLSWLQVCPRFKIDRDGDRILNNAELYLKVAERTNEFIHTADRDPLPGRFREVNCALESTSWRLSIFQRGNNLADKSLLLASQLVYIIDPETQSALTIAQRELESVDDSSPDEGEQNSEYIHEYGDIVIDQSLDHINSNFLWIIETNSVFYGGPIKWKAEQVRLKHLNTGRYLQFKSKSQDHENEAEAEEIIYTTCESTELEGTLFNLTELNNPGKFLGNSKALQIGHNGYFLERGESLPDSIFTYVIKATKDKAAALSLIVNRYFGGSKSDKEEDEELENNSDKNINKLEPLDVFVGLSARLYLRKFYEMTVIPTSDSINTIWPNALRTDQLFFNLVADRTLYFSQGFPISSINIQLGIDKADTQLRIQRQNLLREQNILEVVLRLINKLIPITEIVDKMKNATAAEKRKKTTPDEVIALVSMGQAVLTKCFNLLYYAIQDNEENQMYIADFMPVLLAHLSAQPLAGKCVTEMLSKNVELQETKIGTREIAIFVDKLRSSKMNVMYLQLLQACCSCQGEGIDGNQGKVTSLLFSDTNDIIIQLHADYTRSQQVIWEQPSLYIPASPIEGCPLRSEFLFSKGLPQLSLAWTTNSIDFSPLGLFGKLSVNVGELFRRSSPATIASEEMDKKSKNNINNKKKTALEQKQAVANYFIAEMFLGAEMCMDRNYIAMHKLDNLFPYEVLVTVMKMDVSNNLKSAAVRLLMCLHVDRDPQATSKIPCLTRSWNDIKRHKEPQLPYVDPSRRFTFGLIQQLVSEHIRQMAGSNWDELSQHMLKMLSTLIQFNFYGTNERMKDVIGPLITALDRRKVVQIEVVMANTSKKNKQSKPKQAMIELDAEQKEEEKPENTADAMDVSADMDGFDKPKSPSKGLLQIFGGLFVRTGSARIGISDVEGEDNVSEGIETFHSPLRYSKAPIYELETMVEGVDILAFVQRVIEDRNISLLLKYFYAWESGSDKRSPEELFEQVIIDFQELTLGIADFDNIMIDILMFVHTPLTQSTLEVLMAHHSTRRILLNHARGVQLLGSIKKERQFKIVDQMLQQLEQNAETQELWGELETEADYAVNKQTKDILKELTDICKVRKSILEFDEEYAADTDIQDLYRNLGCFEICQKVLGLFDSIEEDEDGELSKVALNTKEVVKLCNSLMYWYFLGNAKNQEQGFDELDFFLNTLDAEIGSHMVIKAIFKNNEVLMRQVPHSHLATMVDKIVKDGKSHHYLALFDSISYVGDKNIIENQFEIVRTLTSPGRIQKVACYLVPIEHPDYQEKRELMLEVTDDLFNGSQEERDISLDELPSILAYHLQLIGVLAGCTVGRLNITSVEAKVQSVMNYVDIADSILDESTLLVAKIYMTRFLFNSFIEVELTIPGLASSASIWRLLLSYQKVLEEGVNNLTNLHLSWDNPKQSCLYRQKVEYCLLCIMLIKGYFSSYYDADLFGNTKDSNSKKGEKTNLTKSQINQLITEIYDKLIIIQSLESCCRLNDAMKAYINDAIDVLLKSNPKINFQRGNNDSKPTSATDNKRTMAVTPNKTKDEAELYLLKKYDQFLTMLESSTSIQYKADNENVAFISILERLPFIANQLVVSDVRYETLIKKLVYHIRENIKVVNNQKRLDARVTKTSRWIIRAFRTMIENKMGMSIYERDENGGEEQDIAAAPVVNAFNSCGATALCLDLIADGIDEGIQLEAIRLGVGLLFKEGGALEVQGIMNNYLSKTNSELFFKQVRLTLQKLQAWHNWNGIVVLDDGTEPKTPPEILIVRFLQLMCEGHYLPNQDIMREQPNNRVTYNLLDDFVNYQNCLSRIPCRTSTVAGIRLSATILEVIQGPCEGNQTHFALNTELIETLNRLMRSKITNDCVEEEETELKKTCVDIFQGLLEGQGEKSVVYERLLSVIHLDIIQMMANKPLYNELNSKEGQTEPTEEQLILQTECVVLLQMLCDAKPSLSEEIGISRNIDDIVGSDTACIEVIWRGDIHRRFFHVPSICKYLAKSSKDGLVEFVDRSNAENKLIDFLSRSHELYREIKHQQLLTELNLSRIFSRRNQDMATWFTFILSCVINGIFIATYTLQGGTPTISPTINNVTNYLNIVQVVVSCFTLLMSLVVRSPVKYETFLAEGNNEIMAMVLTATEPLLLYYMFYVTMSILGYVAYNYYCSLLLLDIIVKDSTTRDVLNAVVTPRKGLVMGFLLQFFIIYIYAFFTFIFFRPDIDPHCNTLWDCLKFTLSYGLQNGGGVGDSFSHATGVRLILDLTFFAVVLIILLNVIFGMIIDTFSSLRAEKLRRIQDTLEVCFICSIDKQVFDRASDEPDGFKTHIRYDHNMWNYLYFIFLLWEQDKDDDDGLEQYVRRAIEANEITWFPLNKAMRLEQVASASETLKNELNESVKLLESKLTNKFDEFSLDINTMMQ
eukprot:gene8072-10935_t